MAAASADDLLIASLGWHNEVHAWSLRSDSPIAAMRGGLRGNPIALAFSPMGAYLVHLSESGITVWDGRTLGNQILRWTQIINDVQPTGAGDTLVAGYDHEVESLDARTGRRIARAPVGVNLLAASGVQGGLIAGVSEDNSIRLWTRDLKPVDLVAGPLSSEVTALAFHPRQPRIAAGTDRGSIEIWDIERREKTAGAELGHRVNHLLFSADGAKLIVSLGDPTNPTNSTAPLRLLDGENAKPIAACQRPASGAFLRTSISPDGGTLLTGMSNSGMAFLFDPEARLRAQLDAGGVRVTATAFTPDNSRAVIAHSDGALAIWDLKARQLLVRLYNEPADTLYFSPDGSRLYAHHFDHLRVLSTEVFRPR